MAETKKTVEKLPEESIKRVLDYCRDKAKGCYGNAWKYKPKGAQCVPAAMLLLMESHFSTGLRAEELLSLKIKDLPEWSKIAADLRISTKPLPQDIDPEIVKKWCKFLEDFNQAAIRELNRGNYHALRTSIFVEYENRYCPMEFWTVCKQLKLIARDTGVDLRAAIMFQGCQFFGQTCKRERPCRGVIKKDDDLKFQAFNE